MSKRSRPVVLGNLAWSGIVKPPDRLSRKAIVVFKMLADLLGIKTVTKDVEAKLRPTPESLCQGKGEVELTVYGDGSAKVECEIKHSDLPDFTDVDFVVGGETIATLTIHGGRASMEWEVEPGGLIPFAGIGDTAEALVKGKPCYRGTFKQD